MHATCNYRQMNGNFSFQYTILKAALACQSTCNTTGIIKEHAKFSSKETPQAIIFHLHFNHEHLQKAVNDKII